MLIFLILIFSPLLLIWASGGGWGSNLDKGLQHYGKRGFVKRVVERAFHLN
jgi:hypothetical protein